jgi:hypothetical protein
LSELRKDIRTDRKIKIADEPIEMKAITSGKTDSLISRSAILSQGGSWTIVPKESVLNVPRHLSMHVNGERTGQLVSWAEFYAKNRGWLKVQNVELAQARGDEALAEETVRGYRESGHVVVAVCHKGPISMKPPRVPDEAGKAAQSEPRPGKPAAK